MDPRECEAVADLRRKAAAMRARRVAGWRQTHVQLSIQTAQVLVDLIDRLTGEEEAERGS